MSAPTKDAWNPEQYEKFKAERSQPFYDLMHLLKPSPEARVVDLGCGTGELTAELHQHLKAKQTIGIDSSDQMLEKARAHSTSGLSFEAGNIQTWQPQEKFDVVFSNAALQWCADHAVLFEQLKNAMNPGGQFAVQMPMNHDYPTHLLAKKMSEEAEWARLLNGGRYDQKDGLLRPEDYASLLFRLGFREQNVVMRVYGHVLPSREGVIEWVKGTLLTHFKSRLDESDYARFLDEFNTRLFQELADDKPYFYPFKRVLIWGRL